MQGPEAGVNHGKIDIDHSNDNDWVAERLVFHQLHLEGGEESPKDMETIEIFSHEELLPIPTPWPGVLHFYRCELFQKI